MDKGSHSAAALAVQPALIPGPARAPLGGKPLLRLYMTLPPATTPAPQVARAKPAFRTHAATALGPARTQYCNRTCSNLHPATAGKRAPRFAGPDPRRVPLRSGAKRDARLDCTARWASAVAVLEPIRKPVE